MMREGERSTVEIIAVISSVAILSVALLMLILVLQSKMSQSTITTVPVGPPTNVAGIWTYANTFLQIDDNNTFICGKEKSAWSGTFEGTSYDIITITNYINDYITFEGWIDFNGKVKDKVGSLVILFHGKAIMKYGLGIVGQWSILSGTDDLANLRGEGSFWGWRGYLEYSGKIQFNDLLVSGLRAAS